LASAEVGSRELYVNSGGLARNNPNQVDVPTHNYLPSEGVNVLANCCQRGVRVIAIIQQVDLSGPVANLIASLLFGIAESEFQHSKERGR
jgi:hypothetical protein